MSALNRQIIVNNIKYFVSESQQLSNDWLKAYVTNENVKQETVDKTGFVNLPIEIDTDLQSNQTVFVRLNSSNQEVIYIQTVEVKNGTEPFKVLVRPGQYQVQATGFIENGTVYAINVVKTLTVVADGSTKLQLNTQRGANLKVHGFPDLLSFGISSDQIDMSGSDFENAKTLFLFKYAGFDGAGDSNAYLNDDRTTTATIQLAATVEKKLGAYASVLPVLISYTCNLSLGDTEMQLQNEEGLQHGFGNLILSLQLAKKHGKASVPAGYIVNPDFLGMCQQGKLNPDYEMPVTRPLKHSLEYRKVEVTTPSSITDTLGGYILAVNWLIRTIAKGATFGWQVNLWDVGRSSDDSDEYGLAEAAKETANYIKSLNVYEGEYRPDFLAIDRYEADDFTTRAYANGYSYGPYEWGRFFDFCTKLSLELQVPVMPWQTSEGRIATTSDNFNATEKVDRSTVDYSKDVEVVQPHDGETKAESVEDIIKRGEPFDLTNPSYGDFPLRGIFAVLLGGGATTGSVSTIGSTGQWTEAQLKNYMDNPISLDTSD